MPVSALSVLDRQLLLQLGERLRLLREEERTTGAKLAARAGISRSTLSAVEAGDPGASMGMYLRVMSALGVSGDLALLASDSLRPNRAEPAAARSGSARTTVQVVVKADATLHRVQDLKSLALHEAAVAAVRLDPQRLSHARSKVREWLNTKPTSRSAGLWREWEQILERRSWRKVLGRSQRAQELRQASPLVIVLTEVERLSILSAVNALRAGVVLGEAEAEAPPRLGGIARRG